MSSLCCLQAHYDVFKLKFRSELTETSYLPTPYNQVVVSVVFPVESTSAILNLESDLIINILFV